MFAYCLNNPLVYYDDGGSKPKSYDETVDDLDDADVFFMGTDGAPNGFNLNEPARNAGPDNLISEQSVSQTVPSEQNSLYRPYIRKGTRLAVEAVADCSPDGYFLDANTGEVIIGKYDLGHVYGHEFWRERDMAIANGWTQKQFNDYMNNPDFYQIEAPRWNRSHIFEMPK